MRKIGVITGTRAEYGILEPLIQKLEESSDVSLQLYVSGMHLSNEYGHTIDQISHNITAKIDMQIAAENYGSGMANSVSSGISGFVDTFEKKKPDIVVVLGDRIEPFAATIAALFLRIPVAHIHGGDVSPSVFDEKMRHAITKMASLHFPASALSEQRILKMGEEKWRVHNVGSLGLDSVLRAKTPSKSEIFQKYGLVENKKTMLVIFHPTTIEWENSGEQFATISSAIQDFDCQKVVIYPNADAGGHQIIEKIRKLEKNSDYFVFKSLPHEDYIAFMKSCEVMVGNSSSGIIEAPSLALPFVNVGTRQEGRERAKNVLDVGYDRDEIREAIKKALKDAKFLKTVSMRESPYGDGHAAEKIVSVLKNTVLDDKLIKKKMTY